STAGKHKKGLLSEDRIVAFQLVAIEWVVPVAARVGVLARRRISFVGVQRIFRIPASDIPPISALLEILVLCRRDLSDCCLLDRHRLVRAPAYFVVRLVCLRFSLTGLRRDSTCQRTIHWTLRQKLLCRLQLHLDAKDFPRTHANVLARVVL